MVEFLKRQEREVEEKIERLDREGWRDYKV
jgi:hypothetical protein